VPRRQLRILFAVLLLGAAVKLVIG